MKKVHLISRMEGLIQVWQCVVDGETFPARFLSQDCATLAALGLKYLDEWQYKFFLKFALRMLGIKNEWS
jgi:hypothetical protein